MKKILLLYSMIICSANLLAQQDYRSQKVDILQESSLTITGDTNIKAFLCEFDMDQLNKEQQISFSQDGRHLWFRNTVLRLKSDSFDCGNRAINRDFHALIKSEEHPEIFLELKEIELKRKDLAEARVLITIAGKQGEYTIPVKLLATDQDAQKGVNHLQGTMALNISDYGLEPPKKLFGLIVVKDDIQINFNLKIKG